MYGRFGMHTEPVRDEIVTPYRAQEIDRDYQVKTTISIGGLELMSDILELRSRNKHKSNLKENHSTLYQGKQICQ